MIDKLLVTFLIFVFLNGYSAHANDSPTSSEKISAEQIEENAIRIVESKRPDWHALRISYLKGSVAAKRQIGQEISAELLETKEVNFLAMIFYLNAIGYLDFNNPELIAEQKNENDYILMAKQLAAQSSDENSIEHKIEIGLLSRAVDEERITRNEALQYITSMNRPFNLGLVFEHFLPSKTPTPRRNPKPAFNTSKSTRESCAENARNKRVMTCWFVYECEYDDCLYVGRCPQRSGATNCESSMWPHEYPPAFEEWYCDSKDSDNYSGSLDDVIREICD